MKSEGEQLQKSGCVKQIFGNHLYVQGRVEDGAEVYRTSLRLQGDEWVGQCSSTMAGRSSAVYATMLERVERGGSLPEAPNEIGAKSLVDLLEEGLDRGLDGKEEAYVEKLEKRYRRYEMEQEVFDHDLVRLNSKWPTESYDPLELWNEAPKDVVEFWNYIAYSFQKKNLLYPKFMAAVTDLEGTREKIHAWERDRELADWREKIGAVAAGGPAEEREAIEFRMLVLSSEARLQSKREGGEWRTLAGQTELDDLAEAFDEGGLVLDAASDLLWARSFERLRQSDGSGLRLEEEENCRLLGRLFEQSELKERLVTLDERTFEQPEQPLRWECLESEGESGIYVVRLLMGNGEAVSHSMRVLPGVVDRYLGDETVFKGPKNWTASTEIDPQYDVPEEVLATERGVEYLAAIGANLPKSLDDRTVDVPLLATLDMRLARGLTGADSEHLLAVLVAEDADGKRKEVLKKEGWDIEVSEPAEPGMLLRYVRTSLYGLASKLGEMSLVYDFAQSGFKTRVTKTFPEKFVDWLKGIPETVTVEMEDDLASLIEDPVRAKVKFELTEGEIDWFDLKIVLDVEGLDLSQKELRALVAARGGYVRMDTGGWMRLEFDLDDAQRAAVDRLGLDIFDLSGEEHKMHVLQLSDPAAKEVFDKEAWDRICERAAALKLKVTPAVPEQMDVTLRNYQVEGFHFLSYLASNRFGGILADDMGLGKTVQALTWIVWMKAQAEEQKPTLVVCPKSVLDVWSGECKKFAGHLRVQVLRTKEDLDMELLPEIDLLVLNYSQLRVNGDKLQSIDWMAVVLDEGQQIKNPDSKAAKSARELKANHRLVLTGTPIENRLLDMWSLMAFAMPGVLGDRKYFKERFDRRKDPGAQVRLSARLRPFLLRRTKSQVAVDLPPRTEEEVFCKMEGVQEEMYNAELKRIQNILMGLETDDALRKNSFVVLQGLMRLRQICCHPGLLDSAQGDEESAKMNALFYLLDQLKSEGHKVLVFSQFVTMLDLIKERLEEEKRPYEYLTGQTKNRQEVIDRFQTSDDPTVFLLSLKAGGSGLNLTAASYVVLYDPWWNPAVENQAIDRTHRIGQKNKVIAYRLLMRDSVEEKIRVLQEQKMSLVTGVLGQESFTKNLTKDDLSFLFETQKK